MADLSIYVYDSINLTDIDSYWGTPLAIVGWLPEVGASGLIDWSNDYYNGSISMFVQFKTAESGLMMGQINIISIENGSDKLSLRYCYGDFIKARIINGVSDTSYGSESRLLSDSVWYDIGLSIDARKGYLYLFVVPSSTDEHEKLFENSSNLNEQMDIYDSLSALPVRRWTGIEFLASNSYYNLNEFESVYIQNPMIMSGVMSPADFNTYRRLCHMWDKKTEIYPK